MFCECENLEGLTIKNEKVIANLSEKSENLYSLCSMFGDIMPIDFKLFSELFSGSIFNQYLSALLARYQVWAFDQDLVVSFVWKDYYVKIVKEIDFPELNLIWSVFGICSTFIYIVDK